MERREHPGGGAPAGARGGGSVGRERRPAAPADAVRDARGPAGDGAAGAHARRAVPGVRRVRGQPGRRALQGGLLPRLLRRPHGLAPRLPGAAGGAGRVHGGVRPGGVRRERPGPGAVGAERGGGHRGPRRRAGPGRPVPPRLLLARRPRRVGRHPVHPAPAGGGGADGAGDQLPLAWAAAGRGAPALQRAARRRPVVAPGRLLRAVAAALVDEPAVAAHLHRRRRVRDVPQRARREEPGHGARQRDVPAAGEDGDAAGRAGVLLPRHGRHVREVARVRAHGPRRQAAVPRARVPGRRGRRRARAAAAAHLPHPRLGQLPRAPPYRTLLVSGARTRRQDRQHAPPVVGVNRVASFNLQVVLRLIYICCRCMHV